MSKAPFVLLVNPWITDFAAYDLWAKPLGLLSLASLLRDGGCGVAFIDCLDRGDPFTNDHPDVLPGAHRRFGTGKYPRMLLPKPEAYAEVPRHFYRYGIHPESFRGQLGSLPKPDLVWVTSTMTYWYPGIVETIRILHEVFAEVSIWLGGIYAGLCTRHAIGKSGADEVVTLPASRIPEKLAEATGFTLRNSQIWGSFQLAPSPALDLISHLTYAPIMTSKGCPFRCPYCASGILQPQWEKKTAHAIYGEILKWRQDKGIVDFAFYDDALLLHAEKTLKPALERVCKEGLHIRFHTPNAVHISPLSADWAQLLFESGFTTIRLGLETTQVDRQREWGGKVETKMFFEAVKHLISAGFLPQQIGVYLLCGLPGQSPQEVAEAIGIVRDAGAHPHLAEYSPVPGTPLWPHACSTSRFDLEGEPLFHNNTFFACRRTGFTYQDLLDLKRRALEARQSSSL